LDTVTVIPSTYSRSCRAGTSPVAIPKTNGALLNISSQGILAPVQLEMTGACTDMYAQGTGKLVSDCKTGQNRRTIGRWRRARAGIPGHRNWNWENGDGRTDLLIRKTSFKRASSTGTVSTGDRSCRRAFSVMTITRVTRLPPFYVFDRMATASMIWAFVNPLLPGDEVRGCHNDRHAPDLANVICRWIFRASQL